MNAKAIREKRQEIAKAIRAMADKINAEGRDFTAEENEAWTKANTEYDALGKQLERAERLETIGREQAAAADSLIGRDDYNGAEARRRQDGHVQITEEIRTRAMGAWLRHQEGMDLSEAEIEACKLVGLRLNSQFLRIPLLATADYRAMQSHMGGIHPSHQVQRMMEFRATMGTGIDTAGGFLIPPETLVRTLEINMLWFGGMRQVADSIRTTSGERIPFPTADDTSNTGAQLGESTSFGSSTDPTLAKVYLDAYKFSSKPILVPFELLQDSVFNLPQILGQMMGERLGRITNTKFTIGTGAATPKGITVCVPAASGTGKQAAGTGAITTDDIINLIHSVDPAYRNGASFMFHDTILLTIRKLKSSQGISLWQPSMTDGVPDRMYNYGFQINNDMDATMASGKISMLFGQLFKYKIRTVGEVRLYRLDERYRDLDQTGWVAFTREDGTLLTAGTSPVKCLYH